jgi:hypothetical protein
MTATPEYISTLVLEAQQCEKKDLGHKRLKQYKVLEEKNIEKKQFGSNEEFLLGSGIKLEVHTDCVDVLERIHDLVIRTNQLNFTKLRSSKEELLELLSSSDVNSGYVSVSDKFGDYGIVGFYAVRNNRAVHFCFSCRTLGMGIEQYVYNSIGRPTLDIVGEVTSSLESEDLPKWINCESSTSETNKMNVGNISQHQVLIKGPCDLFQIFPYPFANAKKIETRHTRKQQVAHRKQDICKNEIKSVDRRRRNGPRVFHGKARQLSTERYDGAEQKIIDDKLGNHGKSAKLSFKPKLHDRHIAEQKRKKKRRRFVRK